MSDRSVPLKGFRDLIAWQRGHALYVLVHTLTRAMPTTERFGLSLQMRRSAESVPSNIAEGYGLGTRPMFLKHLRIARGSLFELDSQCECATAVGVLDPHPRLTDLTAECARVLQGLISSIELRERRSREGPPPPA